MKDEKIRLMNIEQIRQLNLEPYSKALIFRANCRIADAVEQGEKRIVLCRDREYNKVDGDGFEWRLIYDEVIHFFLFDGYTLTYDKNKKVVYIQL